MPQIEWEKLFVYVSGRFADFKKEELHALVLGRGARVMNSFAAANAVLTADPEGSKTQKARDKGKTILVLEDLGAPLENYTARLEAALAAFQEQFSSYNKKMVYHLAMGPPASDALMGRVEDAVGFALPNELRTLMSQFNGLSFVGAELARGAQAPEFPEEVLPYATLADLSHPLWRAASKSLAVSTIAIPTWEDVFLCAPKDRITGESPYGDKEKLKIGKLKVKAKDFYERLYPFDLFHDYHGAALYADPVAKEFKIIYATDHWADLTNAHPVPLRVYMECLIGMVSHRGSYYEQRIIKPLSKTAWPTYIKNIHNSAYIFLETRMH